MNVKEQLAWRLFYWEIITANTKTINNYQIFSLGHVVDIPDYMSKSEIGTTKYYINAQPQTLMRSWRELGEELYCLYSPDWIETPYYDKTMRAPWQFKGLNSQGKVNRTEYTLHPKFYQWLKQYVKEIKEVK